MTHPTGLGSSLTHQIYPWLPGLMPMSFEINHCNFTTRRTKEPSTHEVALYTSYESLNNYGQSEEPEVGCIWSKVGGKPLPILLLF